MNEIEQGKVSKLFRDKGFGFLSYKGAERDLFFHATVVLGVAYEDLQVGDDVTFVQSVGQGGKPAASVVRRIG